MRRRFVLVLEDAGPAADVPTIIRLRRVLKDLLRKQGFRCKAAWEEIGDRSVELDRKGDFNGEAIDPAGSAGGQRPGGGPDTASA